MSLSSSSSAAVLDNTAAQVEGVRVKGTSDTLVQVKWNPVSGIPTEALSYVITYYGAVPEDFHRCK